MRQLLILSACVLAVSGPAGASQLSELDPDCPTVVRAWFADPAMVAELSRWTEPWEVRYDRGFVVLGVDADGFERLLAAGFEIDIDDKLSELYCRRPEMLPDQLAGIPGYPCYRTVEETFATAQQIAVDHPDLASWIDVGDSWEKVEPGGSEGFDMMVLRLTNANVVGTPPAGQPDGKPRLLVTSAIHAREYTTAELVTRFAEYLVTNYGIDPDATWLLDEHEVHLVLVTNPDGRKHAESGLSWRKNTNENYCSPTSTSRGADLNRNFEFNWGCCGGSSGFECDPTYRGPSPVSEPEVQAAQAYAQSIFPDQRDDEQSAPAPENATGVYLDVHSSGRLVLWPWGFTSTPTGNGDGLQTLGRKLAWFNNYYPEQAIGLYPTDGTTVDFVYGDLGVPAYVFELGTTFFQDCSTFESRIRPDNVQSLLHAAKVARTPYMTPSGPDTLAAHVLPNVVAGGELVTMYATVDDTRFNHNNGTEPIQTVAGAEFFLGLPSWAVGALPLPMTATDGAFDSTVEQVTATVNTTGFSEGRHTVFFEGEDADGNRGPASAAFLWVLDPVSAAHIAGNVSRAGNGEPLAGTVTATPFATTSGSGGDYDLMLPSGTYDVTGWAPGHSAQTVSGVVATSGDTTLQDFSLVPHPTELIDDVEGVDPGWTADEPWAITTATSSSPTHAWTDSPGGNYGDGIDTSLTSPAINLGTTWDVALSFQHRYDIEIDYDYGYVEYSTDNGATWQQAAVYTGYGQTTWTPVVLPLPALDWATDARVRFRLESDGFITADGWYVDDIVLTGTTSLIFEDGFESGDTSSWSSTVP